MKNNGNLLNKFLFNVLFGRYLKDEGHEREVKLKILILIRIHHRLYKVNGTFTMELPQKWLPYLLVELAVAAADPKSFIMELTDLLLLCKWQIALCQFILLE